MAQNRNKLIDLFIGNLVNAVLHRILEKAILDSLEIAVKYKKEIKNSWEIAKAYREKINPRDASLPPRDTEEIRSRAISRIKSEIAIRMSKTLG
ncbi:MAG TPA: hypothetical protein VJA86_00385 [Candidatus Nanoarchaeia archaeon]|nr:hypothetical protein [Candidatus Nanoarchaeia archaeon]